MSDNVIALGGGPITSDRRTRFLETVAQAWELYVDTYGYEPDAIVYVLCGAHQASQIGWQVEGASETAMSSVLSLAAVHCLTEAGSSRQGLNDDG